MTEPVKLSNVPKKFLDAGNWASLRKFASQDIIALCYINAPYPDDEDPSSFFWNRRIRPTKQSDATRLADLCSESAVHS
jgi:hypothetical protein